MKNNNGLAGFYLRRNYPCANAHIIYARQNKRPLIIRDRTGDAQQQTGGPRGCRSPVNKRTGRAQYRQAGGARRSNKLNQPMKSTIASNTGICSSITQYPQAISSIPDMGSTAGTEWEAVCFAVVRCAVSDMPGIASGIAISEEAEILSVGRGDEFCSERDISGAINNISIASRAITAGSLACDNRIRNDKWQFRRSR